jgi:hypothetical protein
MHYCRPLRTGSPAVLRAVLAAAVVVSAPAIARAQIVLDLAQVSPGKPITLTVAPGKLSAVLVNALPGRPYSQSIEIQSTVIPPLAVPNPVKTNATCEDPGIATWKTGVENAKSEIEIRTLMGKIPPTNDLKCTEVIAETVATTRRPLDNLPTIASGQQVTISIERDLPQPATYQFVLKVPAGGWLTTYGLAFAMNRDRRYYVSADQGAATGTVAESSSSSGLKLIPAIFFSWMPWDVGSRTWVPGLTGGLGATSDNVALFGGFSVNYHQNLQITLGVAAAQFTRLADKYSGTTKVDANLSSDALHQKVFLPTFFVSGTFGFGSNPFGGSSGK